MSNVELRFYYVARELLKDYRYEYIAGPFSYRDCEDFIKGNFGINLKIVSRPLYDCELEY